MVVFITAEVSKTHLILYIMFIYYGKEDTRGPIEIELGVKYSAKLKDRGVR